MDSFSNVSNKLLLLVKFGIPCYLPFNCYPPIKIHLVDAYKSALYSLLKWR